ncbi:SseB family protein [Streptomyces vinaceus]|uniref:SseB family protein n=1 Tax=Streptomyces vinaceus TaxID=1960 RepID=UPI0035DA19E9
MARRAALDRLTDFRGRVVLVPLDERGGLWIAELGGLNWICAFSDVDALARFAAARGEAEREWPYLRITGARLLDELIPALDAPCGVALDAAGAGGAIFPPVRGVVPESAALDGEVVA